MAILQQVAHDAAILRSIIASLKLGACTVTSNGVQLTGAALEAALEKTRRSNQAQLDRLELILESKIIPDKYQSIITKDTYYPSGEELRMRSAALPKASHTFFTLKKSRKKNLEQKNSQFLVISDDAAPVLSFFMEHNEVKKYPKGSFAQRIKKGFTTEGSKEPKYAIKIYHKGMFAGDTVHELRIAMRAAFCYEKLGRKGFAFRANNKQYVVTEWLSGASLDIANQEQIKSMPIPRRIVMAISLLRELNILHKLGFIHNDIKPGNVIINYGKLNFVDLDSVRPKNEIPLHGTVPMFSDRFLPEPQMSYDAEYNPEDLYLKFNEQTDIFALGLTLIHLFQEIYVPSEVTHEINVNGGPIKTHNFHSYSLAHGEKYADHPALQKLLKKMYIQDPNAPMTVEQLITDFKDALSTYLDHEEYLSEDRLVDLSSEYTPEDGARAFKAIEIELLGFNQRVDAIKKTAVSM